MNAPYKKANRDGASPKAGEQRPVEAAAHRLNPDKSAGSSAPQGKDDSSNPLVEADDNIEMVAPAVQEQTGSER